ncbi:MAG: maleylacetoacetate isomerase [Alphaproteobacteria bacterium]|jgi:maleylacetoacetate isomerase
MKLYGYFRSSAAYRVRIALNLKGLAYDSAAVHLVRGGGEQFCAEFLALNPQGLVPAFEDGGAVLTQSLAILEYLEETHPEPALLPDDPVERARVRALALAIACDIHPLNNLRVLSYVSGTLGQGDEARAAWYRHWVETGLAAVEALVAGHPMTGTFCHGDTPSHADLCLVPQIANARRFDCDLTPCPELVRIDAACAALAAFIDAAPQNQPDAE